MCMPPLFAPSQRMAEPIPSLSQFFPPPEISSFWGTSIAVTRVTGSWSRDPWGSLRTRDRLQRS